MVVPAASALRNARAASCIRGVDADFRATGAKLNSTYVYDKETGLKLFGKTAFYVKSADGYATFLRKGDAEVYAKKVNGTVLDFEGALAPFTTVASL